MQSVQSNWSVRRIFSKLEGCLHQKKKIGQILHSLVAFHSNAKAWQWAVVPHGFFCSAPNWSNLLS